MSLEKKQSTTILGILVKIGPDGLDYRATRIENRILNLSKKYGVLVRAEDLKTTLELQPIVEASVEDCNKSKCLFMLIGKVKKLVFIKAKFQKTR